MNDNLRLSVKELKMMYGVNYNEIAEYLEIKRNSFYNWLKGYYDLSIEK